MIEKIRDILKEQLDIGDVEITESTSFTGDLCIDSLDLMELVTNLEDEYDIEFDEEALSSLTTVGDLINYLQEKGIEE